MRASVAVGVDNDEHPNVPPHADMDAPAVQLSPCCNAVLLNIDCYDNQQFAVDVEVDRHTGRCGISRFH